MSLKVLFLILLILLILLMIFKQKFDKSIIRKYHSDKNDIYYVFLSRWNIHDSPLIVKKLSHEKLKGDRRWEVSREDFIEVDEIVS